MILQNIIVIIILALCAAYIARKIYNAFNSNDCGCGGCKNCPFYTDGGCNADKNKHKNMCSK